MVPDHLHRIEVRDTGRQPPHLQPINAGFAQEADRLAMGVGAVQHQDEIPPQEPLKQVKESDHRLEADAMV